MGFGETLVALFAIACGTGLTGAFFWACVEIARTRALKGPDAGNAELQALRQEIRHLREQNADLILSFDTAVQRMARLTATATPPARVEGCDREDGLARRGE